MEQNKEQTFDTTQMGMLFKSEFSDKQLETYLNQGKIKASERPDNPPQILWMDDCTIATFGNFSASTGKAKSKKTFNCGGGIEERPGAELSSLPSQRQGQDFLFRHRAESIPLP